MVDKAPVVGPAVGKHTRRPDPIWWPGSGSGASSSSSAAVALVPIERKVWYYRPFELRVSWSYLCALAHLEMYGPTLQSLGVVTLPHAANSRYYDVFVEVALGKKNTH